MSRTIYNENDFPCYVGVVNKLASEFTLYAIYEVGANSNFSTDSIESDYQSTDYRLAILVPYDYFVINTNLVFKTSETSDYSFDRYKIYGYIVSYNNQTFVSYRTDSYFAFVNSTNPLYFKVVSSEYNNILPLTVNNGTVSSSYAQILNPDSSNRYNVPIRGFSYGVTANDGYYCSSAFSLVISGSYSRNDDNTSYTFTSSNNVATTSWVASGSLELYHPSSFTISSLSQYTVTLESSHMVSCVGTLENGYFGKVATVTLTSNNGYEFSNEDIPYISIPIWSGTRTVDCTLSDNRKTATATFTLYEESSGESEYTYFNDTIQITPYAVAVLSGDIPTTSYSFVNIYKVTESQLKELAKYRFYASSSSSPLNLVDLGQYINSLKRFYCDIPISDITSTIVMGNIDSGISCNIVSSDFIELDCGNVSIETTNNNSNDYSNTVYAILPFVGQVSLDSNYIMNRTISIMYRISVISGECVVIISDTTDNIPLYTFNGNVSENVPYIIDNILWELKGDFNNPSCVLYGFIPTIVIIYNDNYNDNGYYNDERYGTISEITNGLCEISDITFSDSSGMTDSEIERIRNVLSNGVIFD